MGLRIVSTGLVFFLAGCDPSYGVDSHTALAGPVDVRCVNAALANIVEAGRVTYERSESRSTEIMPTRRSVRTVMHVWTYGEGGKDILQINQTSDGWDYRNARSRLGVAVPHDEMVRFVPVVTKVNVVMQARCGLPVAGLKSETVGETRRRDR